VQVFPRFFIWVWGAVILLPVTGIGMININFSGLQTAPRYVQVLPELPRMIHQALQPKPASEQRMLEALWLEQRRTNRLLQAIAYGGLGFVLGLVLAEVLSHWPR